MRSTTGAVENEGVESGGSSASAPPRDESEHRTRQEGKDHGRRPQDALGEDEAVGNRLLRCRVVPRERAREDDLRQAARIDAQRPRDALRGRRVDEGVVQRIVRQHRLRVPAERRREGAPGQGVVRVSRGGELGRGRHREPPSPHLDVEDETGAGRRRSDQPAGPAQGPLRVGDLRCQERRHGGHRHDAKRALFRVEAEHRRAEQRQRHPGQPEAEREQCEQRARSAKDVGDPHDAAHGLGGHRGRDEETAREPSGEPGARPPRDQQDDERPVEAMQEHVHVVVREGAPLAGPDLPERAPDHVRERPVRPDRALGREAPEVTSEGVEPADLSGRVGRRANVRVREQGLLLVEDEVRRRAPRVERHRQEAGGHESGEQRRLLAEEVLAKHREHRAPRQRRERFLGDRGRGGRQLGLDHGSAESFATTSGKGPGSRSGRIHVSPQRWAPPSMYHVSPVTKDAASLAR